MAGARPSSSVTASSSRCSGVEPLALLSSATLAATGAPPRPPLRAADERVHVAYVSSDLGNHPLSHLMQSVFGMHDARKYKVSCYALTPSDQSAWRRKIEEEVEVFKDVSARSATIARSSSSLMSSRASGASPEATLGAPSDADIPPRVLVFR